MNASSRVFNSKFTLICGFYSNSKNKFVNFDLSSKGSVNYTVSL